MPSVGAATGQSGEFAAQAPDSLQLPQSRSSCSAAALPVQVVRILPPMLETAGETANWRAVPTGVPVKFAVRTPPDAPATEVKICVNGRLQRLLDACSLPCQRSGEAPADRDRGTGTAAGFQHRHHCPATRTGTSEPVTILYVAASGLSCLMALGQIRQTAAVIVGVSSTLGCRETGNWCFPARTRVDLPGFGNRPSRCSVKPTVTLTNDQATHQKIAEGSIQEKQSIGWTGLLEWNGMD